MDLLTGCLLIMKLFFVVFIFCVIIIETIIAIVEYKREMKDAEEPHSEEEDDRLIPPG